MEKFGKIRYNTLIMKKQERVISQALKKIKNILAVYLFGSQVYGRKGKLSDLDIGVVFENPKAVFRSPKKSLKIYEKLFDVFLPLAKNSDKLDLVFLQRAPFSLQKEIFLKGKLFYTKDIAKLLAYKETVY